MVSTSFEIDSVVSGPIGDVATSFEDVAVDFATGILNSIGLWNVDPATAASIESDINAGLSAGPDQGTWDNGSPCHY
jgi:hypothetical protein